jgi:hypothetical protein
MRMAIFEMNVHLKMGNWMDYIKSGMNQVNLKKNVYT